MIPINCRDRGRGARAAARVATRVAFLVLGLAVALSSILPIAEGAAFATTDANSEFVSSEPLESTGEPVGSVVLYVPQRPANPAILGSAYVYVLDVNATSDGWNDPVHRSGEVALVDTVETAYLGGPNPGVDDILLYSSATGQFQFASVSLPDPSDSNRRSLDVFADVAGTRGWTHVVTGDYNGDGVTDVLFYRAADGLMRFYTTSATGKFTPITPAHFGTRGWTNVVAGDFDGDGADDVLFYRARDGLIRFYEVTNAGEFRAMTPAYFGTRYWTEIPAGDYDGDGTDDVLFYRDTGIARFYEVDATGTFRALGAAFPATNANSLFPMQIESVELTPATAGVDLVWFRYDVEWVNDSLRATRYDTDNVVYLWPTLRTQKFGGGEMIATGVFP